MRPLLLLLLTAAPALAAPPAATSADRKLAPFNAVSICAPVSVRVRAGPAGSTTYTARLQGDRAVLDALSIVETRRAIAIELIKPVSTTRRVVVDLIVPPRTLQYVERVFGAGDTVLDTEFDPDKCEVAASGAGNWWAPRVGSLALAKASLGAPSQAYINASAPFVELFASSPNATVRLDGATGTVSARLDAGAATVNPSTDAASITGYVMRASLAYTRGTCAVRDEGGAGRSCVKVGAAAKPAPPPLKWSCGFETRGEWACGGGGRGGAPSVTATECEAGDGELDMLAD